MSLATDLLVGIRQARHRPGSAILAITAYAFGLGVVGFMLTIIFGLVRGHPDYIEHDRLMFLRWDPSTQHLWKSGAQNERLRYADFRELHEQQDVFEAMAAQRDNTFSVLIDKFPARFHGSYVTAEFFRATSLEPQIGRFFHPGEDTPGSPKKAVISDSLWRNEFAASPDIVGSFLTINGVPTEVIGVTGPGVDFPALSELWVNETSNPLETARTEGPLYMVFGLLKPDQTPASAKASLDAIASQLESAYPETNTGYRSLLLQNMSDDNLGQDFKRVFYLAFGCAVLVLLIACANVANLTLSRVTSRVRELAIRSSLGGSRFLLIRQMVFEGFFIAAIGGIGGLIIAIWTSQALWSWVVSLGEITGVPNWMSVKVDLRVIVFLSFFTLFASVIASIVPAIKASRADVNEILKDNARGSSGLKIGLFSKALVSFQLFVSCGLLIATTAMVVTAQDGVRFTPPYDPEGMMVARIDLPAESYPNDPAKVQFLNRLQQRLEASPDLELVGFTSAMDMVMNWNTRWEIEGRDAKGNDAYEWGRHEIVSDNYLQKLDIPILDGRGFDAFDFGQEVRQVCVVNSLFAEKVWPGENPIGKRIRDTWQDTNPWITVVGIVPDTQMAGPGSHKPEDRAGVYRPLSSFPGESVSIFAKSSASPTAQAQAIRSVILELDPHIALYRIKPVTQAIQESNIANVFFRNIFGFFGVAALALSSIGVYGVMDFSVRQRFQEFGIRQALGAQPKAIVSQVFRLGAVQTLTGLSLGTLLGIAVIAVIGQNIGGIASNVFIYLLPIFTIATIATLSLLSPTREIIRADLANTLREE